MSEFLKQALERLKKESTAIKGGKAAIMKGAVREALESFARRCSFTFRGRRSA